jgi:hypothetical protein
MRANSFCSTVIPARHQSGTCGSPAEELGTCRHYESYQGWLLAPLARFAIACQSTIAPKTFLARLPVPCSFLCCLTWSV